MSLIRFQLDLAIPEEKFDDVLKAKLAQRIVPAIRELKALAVKINEGKDNEEMTVRASWHRCHHDTGNQPCEPEQEI